MIWCGMRSVERGRRRTSLLASDTTAVRRRLLFAHEVVLRREVFGIEAIGFRRLLGLRRRLDRYEFRRVQIVGEREREGLEASSWGVAEAGFLFTKLCALPKRPDLMES